MTDENEKETIRLLSNIAESLDYIRSYTIDLSELANINSELLKVNQKLDALLKVVKAIETDMNREL